ncbi:hypothetical protein [Bacillus mycoides]|uniref:hypothetical protein n=1 Tax=Bacillus mycoides TaxID=1405 RepID=UPI001C016647|nr:hypothetical protein [Bacillus mycoides]
MDNNIRNTKRTSIHHRPTEERTGTGGGLNDGKSTITFHTISSNMRCDIVSSFVRQAYQAVDEGCEMMTKEQRDEYEQKKIIAMIRDLRAKGVHNSADKGEETYKYITLAK